MAGDGCLPSQASGKTTSLTTPAHPEPRALAREVEGPAPTLAVQQGLRQALAERGGTMECFWNKAVGQETTIADIGTICDR